MRETGILIIGHGSRDPGANDEFERLVAAYRARHPECLVAHGYVELAAPLLEAALDALAIEVQRVVVLPLFLFAAGHVKNDVPIALERARNRHPGVSFVAARALGVHPLLVELALERARVACAGTPAAELAVLVVGRGSSDPDANGDFCKLVRLLGENLGVPRVFPCFAGVTRPLLRESAELMALSRPQRLVVLPYFLFGGRLIEKLTAETAVFAARYPWIATTFASYLGSEARVLELLDERMQEALHGARPLACDTCQYRVPIAGLSQRVGGLQALLFSIRHEYTHAQAQPALHAHPLLKKHVLVCGNADCAERGSLQLLDGLRKRLRALGRDREIRVTRTSCMGRCGEGPTVAVYPDGIWYRRVSADDGETLLSEHLLADRIVPHLVDSIMT